MNITIDHLIEGAQKATGLTVIIDVFRAFSVACYVMHNNPSQYIVLGDINLAYELKEKDPNIILIGERNEKKPLGFNYGNSPSEIKSINFNNKTIVHTTSAGTQGIAYANKATEIITGSFVNIDAIVEYIRKIKPTNVSLVCMGYAAQRTTDEDSLCAEYIKNALENKKQRNFNSIKEILKTGDGKRFFLEENQAHSPKIDFDLCLAINQFNFVLIADKQNTNYRLTKKY